MKIIVAGGTGFLGKKIVSSLADKGHNVCVLTRNLQKHKNTFSNNVNVIDERVTSLESSASAMVDSSAALALVQQNQRLRGRNMVPA